MHTTRTVSGREMSGKPLSRLQMLNSCAFFSQRLSPVERNYDVGDCDLLAVILALKEWRHWLERSEQLFVSWANHKNLSYLQSAQRLNSRQAWCAISRKVQLLTNVLPSSKLACHPGFNRMAGPRHLPMLLVALHLLWHRSPDVCLLHLSLQ